MKSTFALCTLLLLMIPPCFARPISIAHSPVILDLPESFKGDASGITFTDSLTQTKITVLKPGSNVKSAKEHLSPDFIKVKIDGTNEAYLSKIEFNTPTPGHPLLVGDLIAFTADKVWIVQIEMPANSKSETQHKGEELLKKICFKDR